MGTTAGGLPYPEPTDPIAAGADAIKALAQAIDGDLYGDTGWQTAAVPAAMASGTLQYRAVGAVVTVTFNGLKSATVLNDQLDWVTLPARYRPAVTVRGVAVAFGGSAPSAAFQNGLRLNVATTGIVSTTGNHAANAFIQGGITYLAAIP